MNTPRTDTLCGDSTAACLATLLGSRGAGTDLRVRRLLERHPLPVLGRLDALELASEGGLTRLQAERLAAAFALGREVERARIGRRDGLRAPGDVARLMTPELRGLEKETFHTLVLDAKHRLRARGLVSEGTLSTSLVHPREVFRAAIRTSGASIVVCHNHPSGDPEPSAEDEAVTRRLIEAGHLLGIPLLDHVIVGDGAWVSLRERLDFGTGPRGS